MSTQISGRGEREGELRSGDGDSGSFERRLADGLGWFSNGLALAQLAMPRRFARAIGAPDGSRTLALVRLVGAREVAAGVGILVRPRPVGWLWARVAGDVMDLALLGAALSSNDSRRKRVGTAAAAVAGVTVLDALAAQRLAQRKGQGTDERADDGKLRVTKVMTVNRPPDEAYAVWRDFTGLPRFMTHLESVEETGEGRWRWKASGPAGKTVEWEAEVTEDRPAERIGWRSLPGGEVETSGVVTFAPAPGGRGTEVRVELGYSPPAGLLGATVAWLFGEDPKHQLDDDLRRFKQVLETGEIVRSEGSPQGPSLAQHLRQRAAQPLERESDPAPPKTTPAPEGSRR